MTTPTSPDRLPSPPRQRRPAMAALAVVLIVGGASLAGLLAIRVDQRVAVVVADRDIPVGTKLIDGDLGEGRIAADNVATISKEQAAALVGMYATRTIRRGQLIDPASVDREGFLREGAVAVGVPMAAGRVPAQGLQIGDVVQVLRIPKEGPSTTLVARATVSQTTLRAATSGITGGSSGTTVADGNQAATLMVEAATAPAVAAASAANEISLILVERGASTKANG